MGGKMDFEDKTKPEVPVYLVSSCLMGLATRYDGVVKTNRACQQALAGEIWIPVCPEQLGGLPTPRLSAELTGGQGDKVLAGKASVMTREGIDVTKQFVCGAQQVLYIAEQLQVTAAFLKSGSPSCGAGKVLGVTAALLQSKGISVRKF